MPPPFDRSSSAFARILSILATALVLGTGIAALTPFTTSVVKTAAAYDDTQALRDLWQGKYRMLLKNRATLNNNLVQLKHDYGQAQRRNYPRGGARQALLEQARQAEQELAQVQAEIASIFSDARRQEIPPGWLYEVEDETIEPNRPAAPDAAGGENAADDDGRNPLYSKDDDS